MLCRQVALRRNPGKFMNKLLVIEDDPTMTKLLQNIFTSDTYSVISAGTAAEGFRSCLEVLPDLVLMAVVLPDGSGIDQCRVMKENQHIKHIPIIVLTTASTSAEDRMRILESGAEGYMRKPFLNDELAAQVAGALKRSHKGEGQAP